MAINTRDELIDALFNNSSRIVIDKASIANAAAGQFHSLFRATGQPGQGAIPTAAAVCDNTLIGALGFTQQTAPATSYLAQIEAMCSNAGTTLEIHDRLMHMGGLSGTVATAQTANVDIAANLATANLDARKGDANYSDVQWWLEWYADTGATVVNATANVTFNDGSSANLTAQSLAATRRASLMIPLNSLIAAADSGKFIRDVNTVTLSATTGTAGNFGVTATRFRASIYQPVASAKFDKGLDALNNEIINGACLFPIQVASTTSTGAVRATGKIIHG